MMFGMIWVFVVWFGVIVAGAIGLVVLVQLGILLFLAIRRWREKRNRDI